MGGWPSAADVRPEEATANATLSVVCMTAGPGARTAALLELLRPVAHEIVVALDDRADDETRDAVGRVADRVLVYPFAEPVDRPLPWLFRQCRSDWMLTIDDDEIPSAALLEALPALLADERMVHYSIARRWLHPTADTFLDEPPWIPDYQLRLFRTDPRLVRFSDALHRPIHAEGPGRFVEQPLWHADPLLRTREQRRAKAEAYERSRPGLRAGGRALNYAFYVPELRPDARLSPLPAEERELVASVLAAPAPSAPPRASVTEVTREEIDAWWPASQTPQEGRLELPATPPSFAPGEERAIDLRVTNTGDETWDWGRDPVVAMRCASWWEPDDHRTAIWTALPSQLAPGESMVVPVHVRAPGTSGTHVLRFGLVQEDVHWTADDLRCFVHVRPSRRVAFLFASPAEIDAAIAADPDVEPVPLHDTLPPGRIGLLVHAARLVARPRAGDFDGAAALAVGRAAPKRVRTRVVQGAYRLAARRLHMDVR